MSKCFMVYPMPSVADESFLNLVFDGGVKRSVFAGFGSSRFALVELRDAFLAEDVLRRVVIASPATENISDEKVKGHLNSSTGNNRTDDGDDVTLAQLMAEPPVAPTPSGEKKNSPGERADSAAAGGALSCVPFIGRLRFRGQRLRVVPSPMDIGELYAVGGHVPEHNGRTANKRNAAAAPERQTLKRPRGCGADAAQQCKRCGSSAHFTRHCDGGKAVAEPQAQKQEQEQQQQQQQQQQQKQQQQQQQQPARANKDQCKHCGSDQHLSRHCPAK